MPSGSNILTVQVGQCGNQLGMAYWERMCREHGIGADGQLAEEDRKGEDCKEIFFNESNCGQKWVPRAVLVDLEPRVLSDICNHDNNPYSDLFDVDNIYQGPTGGGAGNIWAMGYNQDGNVVEDIMAIIETEAERADHLEGFALCHSILGGTGSGLGSRLLKELRDRFPKSLVQTYSAVQPMTCNVQVAPYNIVLSLDTIMEHADMCMLFDNDAFERHCKAANPLFHKLRRDASSEDLNSPKKNYAQINSMMSQVMTGLSAPIRFYSPIYPRLTHICAFLNPFPPMIFSQPAVAPFVPLGDEGAKQNQLVKFPEPRSVLSSLLDPRQLISSCQMIQKKADKDQQLKENNTQKSGTDQMDCLLSGLIILQSKAMDTADPVSRLAGSVASAGMGITDLYNHMRTRNQTRTRNDTVYRSPSWMPSTMNITSCRLSPYMNHDQHPITGLLLANHTQTSVMLKKMGDDFDKMWKRRANVHAFENAFEEKGGTITGKASMEQRMSASKANLDKLLEFYREACGDNFLSSFMDDSQPLAPRLDMSSEDTENVNLQQQ